MTGNEGRGTACLILHGFGGGPYEVAPLADHLEAQGYEVAMPVLAGHTSTPQAMRKATYKDWIDSAQSEFIRLQESGKDVVIIGFSMGGLLAFHLASSHLSSSHPVRAIITINTPIYYWNLRQVFRNLDEDRRKRSLANTRRYLEAKKSSPIPSMFQFLTLLHHTKKKLPEVSCPLLVIQAEDDDTVRRRSVGYIRTHSASREVMTRFFPEGGHVILLSPQAPEVISLLTGFLDDLHP